MNDINKNVNNIENAKNLSELFKEIQDIRYGRAEHKISENEKIQIEIDKNQITSRKFNILGAIAGILVILLFFSLLNSNYIFATTEKKKVAINQYEENKNAINMMEIVSKNVNELTKKEIILKEVEIKFETKYIETDLLPKDEQKLVREGSVGTLERTVINNYEKNTLIGENVINETIKVKPIDCIIEVGTSEYLSKMGVHIGDPMYTKEDMIMYTKPLESTDPEDMNCNIFKDIDVILISEKDGWACVRVDGYEGYVKSNSITSEHVTPGSAEKARINRKVLELTPEIFVNKPSGFTKEDFKKIFSNNEKDKNKIFENNAELFYELEEKYNINGLFIAAIGIHESNWGTSAIAQDKKNLFGYGAYDFSAYESATSFESYQYGIELVSKVLVKYYLNPNGTLIYDNEKAVGTYYNGATIAGVNVRYASDTNWCNRVFEIMQSLYKKLQ